VQKDFGSDEVLTLTEKLIAAKPFLKWAGGKNQLLDEIEQRLPNELRSGEIDTYVEPFVGGGAVFFYIVQNYKSIKHFYLFDINEDLVGCYNAVKHNVNSFIAQLKELEEEFLGKTKLAQKKFYYATRDEFNSDRSPAKLTFLNKTCYNGLYRVNRKDQFNVPFGYYKNPTICDADNLIGVSEILQRAEIICSDFEECEYYSTDRTFIYFDPPYRPLSPTAGFTSYSKEDFNEKDQIRLAEFCRRINSKGAKFLLSNSDPKNENPRDYFFDNQYSGFKIDTVKATRAINCIGAGRGAINELIITNY
jgi:DNA adenine methylase